VHSPRKRAGVPSVPPVVADAPKVVWALDFQFDSTIDGKAVKIASMIDVYAAAGIAAARINPAGICVCQRAGQNTAPRELCQLPGCGRGCDQITDQARSNRSAFITLTQAATKSATNFSFASSVA
jgi:hypothetical protein